ncbi:PLC-like phosphodiesterase, TIM beta/alpha-barrel domain [Pseudocohnilembus persalinus]|uniref:PLC-like phosphodiesterase, TIM beta/alpha-barrel domain n=1 Tax=Pseudocohnilembus persalinus TaxID=266149 RepID=A0A0V0R2H5_PSEPJ|nr:PLC-like phosphodiesterase, TIM beta/alpha-barrel domain [Pseudocohnilembus persalinus]|eukprot:KRX08392.1 PLC-like phosphodiesterase, TIM beta/alpha-barrel domain [Pseudocohnilembus persalinus]
MESPQIQTSDEQFLQTWMKDLPDQSFISNITIPGTHNSLAMYGGYLKITPCQCQSWSVKDQLRAGLRFFDLRGKLSNGKFRAYHEVMDQRVDIKDVFNDFYDFLDKNPSEFLAINLQYELYDGKQYDEQLTKCFEELIYNQQTTINNINQNSLQNNKRNKIRENYWIIQKEIPTVQDSRGKIFLVSNWKYPNSLNWKQCVKQNAWDAKIEEKIKLISEFNEKSRRGIQLQKIKKQEDQQLYVNFLTANVLTKWALSYSKILNKFYSENCNGRGIILMDFPSEQLILKIIQLNYNQNQ